MGLARSPDQIRALHASQIGHLVARVFPTTADLTALQLAVDWTTLFCCLDDRLEQIHGAVLSAAYLRGLLGVFRDATDPQLVDPFSQGFFDLRQRMLNLAICDWVPRFSACVERLFNAFIDEAKFRTMGQIPDFASHRKLRQITVGLYTGFIFGELTDGIILPRELLEHELIQALECTASNIVGLSNDIFTVEKERSRGEVNNTVLVLMHERGLSYDQALAQTIQLHDREMRKFSRLVDTLPDTGPLSDARLRRYVDILIAFVYGHHDWAHHTGRYDGAEPPLRSDDKA